MKNFAKFAKLALTIGLLFAFTACKEESDSPTKVSSYTGTLQRVTIYCDKEKGVEYIIFKDGDSGGVNIRRNADDTISTCQKI